MLVNGNAIQTVRFSEMIVLGDVIITCAFVFITAKLFVLEIGNYFFTGLIYKSIWNEEI